jgi:hypothetical protein
VARYLRLRQICLVAPQLRLAEEEIAAVLGTLVSFCDPAVGAYGLENALFALGADILEVVAPIREGTAAGRFLHRTGGRGGNMAILDCDDAAERQAHAAAMGVRAANIIRHGGYLGVQLHPRDCRATMLEFDTTTGGRGAGWAVSPAGPDWPRLVRPDALPHLLAVEVSGPDPAGLAAHWSRIMRVPVIWEAGVPTIRLLHGQFDFLPDEAERLGGLRIRVVDEAAAMQEAARRGLVRPDGAVWLSGVRVRIEGAKADE